MTYVFLILFILGICATVWIANDNTSRFFLCLMTSIMLSGMFIDLVTNEMTQTQNHTGYTVDTTYTIKNGVKQGVTYTVKEKKK
jgi:hypothetical protein